jgi:8-hydroxy-5-deazaflavin:NADPH oxidoreductase
MTRGDEMMMRIGGTLSRRRFLAVSAASLAGGGLAAPLVAHWPGAARDGQALRIGIIGSGQMGGRLGLLWARAGHEVFFSSRNPDELQELVSSAGGRARAGYPAEAAEFGEVVVIAVPYGALPQVGADHAHLMRDKIVIELGNPREDRDGPMADEALARGVGVTSAGFLPGVRLVRAFNAISYLNLERDAHREGERIGVPVAGDDEAAVATAVRLVEDAGFDPVVVGSLARSREFDRGTPVYVRNLTARQIREALGLP